MCIRDRNNSGLAAEPEPPKSKKDRRKSKRAKQLDKPNSSLTLQIVLFFDWYFSAFYMIATLCFLFYKVYGLPYPDAIWEIEIVSLVLFFALQFIKIDLGSKGNKTEKSNITFLFVLLAILCIFCFVFFLILQTYVLVIEVVLNALGLLFCILEILFGIIRVCIFRSVENSQ